MSVRVEHGDCREVIRTLPDCSVDSCVTDGPYALVSIVKRFGKTSAADDTKTSDRIRRGADGYARAARGFMGQRWDTGETYFDPEFWREVYRVLKPGAHVLAFAGTRTYHRLACAIEDAGFEIRDQIAHLIASDTFVRGFLSSLTEDQQIAFERCIEESQFGGILRWVFGSGFPKSHDVSKGIDKAAGAEREVIRERYTAKRIKPGATVVREGGYGKQDINFTATDTAPATPEAAKWQGWGTALKPAEEPICVARKPLIGTVAENVLEHGTGALNIDGCKVGTEITTTIRSGHSGDNGIYGDDSRKFERENPPGRWPANIILDGSDEVVGAFPADRPGGGNINVSGGDARDVYGKSLHNIAKPAMGDSGSAARFFYSAKADADDRLGSKHPCLTPGELVLTERGLAPIESIEVGALVYADDGTFRSVIDRFASPCKSAVYTIGVEATNLTTRATGNHPFLVWRPTIRYGRARDTIGTGEASWLPAEQIKVGDYLLTPVPALKEHPPETDVDWWFAAGLWMAEGTVLTNGHGSSRFPQYTLALKEVHLVERLRKTFKKIGVYSRPSSLSVVGFQAGVVDRFIALCGKGAKGKFISPQVLAAGDAQRRAFLEGYIAGDGCVVRGRMRAKTASRGLASTLPLLSESLGLRCAVYEYDATGRIAKIEGRQIKQGIYYSILFDFERLSTRYSRPSGRAHSTRFVQHEGRIYSLRRVKAITAAPYHGPVWNLTVEGRHTFQTAVGMSHNTVKPIDLMRYLVRLVTPPKGAVLDPFAGTGTTGVACIAEGFDCILIEREAEYVEDINVRLHWARGDGPLTESLKRRRHKHDAPDDGPLFGKGAA